MKLLFSLFTIITTLLIAYDINLASRSILNATTRQLTNTINKTYSRQITTNTMSVPREIRKSFLAREQPEGDGATVRRAIGTPQMRNLTPFLMLDEFNSTPEAGFPDHPHRGQETITYVLKGSMDHEDFLGNKGRLGAGDLQFMTAGRGVMHSEMPGQDSPHIIGLQLWVDLPEHLKNVEPRYRDLRAEEIPLAKSEDGKVEVKVISGTAFGVESIKELAYTPVHYYDVTIHPGGKLEQTIPAGWTAFAYTMQGAVTFNAGTKDEQTVTPHHNIIFKTEGDVVSASVEEGAHDDAQIILVAGQPHDQPIVQYGPFVTTSKEAVMQAMIDFQTASNGFERAKNWQSEIGKRRNSISA
jgi:quercetin 2,3-dioxygenase